MPFDAGAVRSLLWRSGVRDPDTPISARLAHALLTEVRSGRTDFSRAVLNQAYNFFEDGDLVHLVDMALGYPRHSGDWTQSDVAQLIDSDAVLGARLAEIQLWDFDTFDESIAAPDSVFPPLSVPPRVALSSAASGGDIRSQLVGWVLDIEAADGRPVSLSPVEDVISRVGQDRMLRTLWGILLPEGRRYPSRLGPVLADSPGALPMRLSDSSHHRISDILVSRCPEQMRAWLQHIYVDDSHRDVAASIELVRALDDTYRPHSRATLFLLLLRLGPQHLPEAAAVFSELTDVLCGPTAFPEHPNYSEEPHSMPSLELFNHSEELHSMPSDSRNLDGGRHYESLLQTVAESAGRAVARETFALNLENVGNWEDGLVAVLAGASHRADASQGGAFIDRHHSQLADTWPVPVKPPSGWGRAQAQRALSVFERLTPDRGEDRPPSLARDLFLFLLYAIPDLDVEGLGVESRAEIAARLTACGVQSAALSAAVAAAREGTGETAWERSVLELINRGSLQDIESIPGIGPSTAAAIRHHIATHGAFESIADLEAVAGVGPGRVSAIMNYRA